MLLEDVITEFDGLVIHTVDYPMRRACDRTHDFIDHLRVFFDKALKLLALQAEYLAVTQSPKANLVHLAVNETQLASEVTVTKNGEACHAVGSGPFHYLELSLEQNI